MRKITDKKGAIELSIGTIVIIVLAMSMLIFGLILVRNIFTGSIDNVNVINDKVKDEINKLFVEDKRTVIYLPNQKAEIRQGEEWGVAFAIRNLVTGTPEASDFGYQVVVSDPNVRQKCGVGDADINSWMTTGQADTIPIAPGDTYYGIVRFSLPEVAPLCVVRFHLQVERDGQTYATDFFDVESSAS